MAPETTKLEIGQRVFVVDDDADVRDSIAWILDSVGYRAQTFASADDFLSQQTIAQPSVVLVDLLLPGMTGLSLCREISARRIPCAFAVISGHADVPSAVEAMRLGAIDFLVKPFSHQRLMDVIAESLQVSRQRFKNLRAEEEVAQRMQELSARERDVFDGVAAGLVTKEIAKRLGISVRTVDVHRSRIMQKLGVESPSQLANLLAILERTALRDSETTG